MEKKVRNFSNGIGTERGEMTESRGSVEAVRTVMTTGKVEVTSETTIIRRETCKFRQVETKSQELGIIKETQELIEVTDAEIKRGERIAPNKRGADTNRNGKGY